MAIKALYQHHERTTTVALETDLQLREIGIDPVQKFLTGYSEVLGTKLHAVTQESALSAMAGAMTIALTLGVVGNFSVNTNKFTVNATSGNTVVAGTLAVTGAASASNLSGTNTGDQTSVSGNAGTATILQTARLINGVSFNGSADITVTAAAGTLTGATLAANVLASSLTSVGTLATLTVTAAIVGSVTGNAATVTTNANLTGPITSVGNATSIASQTGTGTTFAMRASPDFTGTVTGVASTWSGTTTLNATLNVEYNNTSVKFGNGVGTATAIVNGAAGSVRRFQLNTDGNSRWLLEAGSTAEAGSDAGSSFSILARTDAGAAIDAPMTIVRASGGAITFARPVTNNLALTQTGAATFSSTISVTGTSQLTGRVGVGGASFSEIGLYLQGAIMAGSNQYGMWAEAACTSASTTTYTQIYSHLITAAASYTITKARSIFIADAAKGAGNTITTLIGLEIENQTQGTTNKAIATGSGVVTFGDTTDSTSITTGGLVLSGGLGVAKRLTLDGGTGKTIRIVNGVSNATVAVTLGSTGPTGSTAGAPQGWMRIDINGSDRYIPYW